MAATAPRRGNLKRSRHERGDRRRKRLIEAAARLVETQPVAKIRLSDVAREADIPLASARHFYKKKHDVLLAVMGAAYPDWFEILRDHARRIAPNTWQELSDALVDATLLFWDRYPVVMKILRGSLSGELASEEHKGDKEFSAPFIHSLFAAHFELPNLPADSPDVFLIYTKLTDTVFSIGIFEHGELTPRYIEETKAVARNYLSLYLPNYLPARDPPGEVKVPEINLRLDRIAI